MNGCPEKGSHFWLFNEFQLVEGKSIHDFISQNFKFSLLLFNRAIVLPGQSGKFFCNKYLG